MAQFNCTVSDGWKILIWLYNGQPKLSVLSSGTPIQTDPRYTQRGHFSGSEFTSELMINDVQLNDSGQVTCSLQNDASESAFLSVQGVYTFPFLFIYLNIRLIGRIICVHWIYATGSFSEL